MLGTALAAAGASAEALKALNAAADAYDRIGNGERAAELRELADGLAAESDESE